jgi:hypothetical protein
VRRADDARETPTTKTANNRFGLILLKNSDVGYFGQILRNNILVLSSFTGVSWCILINGEQFSALWKFADAAKSFSTEWAQNCCSLHFVPRPALAWKP